MVGRELYEAGVGDGFKEGIRKVGIEKRVKAGIRCGRRTREIVFEVEFVVDIIRKAKGGGEDSKWGKVGLGVMAEEGEDDWVNERFVQAVGKIAEQDILASAGGGDGADVGIGEAVGILTELLRGCKGWSTSGLVRYCIATGVVSGGGGRKGGRGGGGIVNVLLMGGGDREDGGGEQGEEGDGWKRIAALALLENVMDKSDVEDILGDGKDILSVLGTVINCGGEEEEEGEGEEEGTLTKIALTLLLAILELGSKERKEDEEVEIEALRGGLDRLLKVGEGEVRELARVCIEGIEERSGGEGKGKEDEEGGLVGERKMTVRERVKEAGGELKSKEAAIRAIGVRKVRGIVRELVEDGDRRRRGRGRVAGIEVVGEAEDKVGQSGDDDALVNLGLVTQVLLRQMSDAESYVYLGAVQGMVDVCDVEPEFGFGVLANVVGRGKVEIEGEVILADAATRVKAAEAIGMAARKREEGGIKFEVLRDAVEVIGEVFKEWGSGRGEAGREERRMIDKGTRGWFEKGRKNEADGEEDEDTSWSEMSVRLQTSGPIYGTEESSMPVASALMLFSSFASTLGTKAVTKFIGGWVTLATDTLRGQKSRTVRRAAGMLAEGVLLRGLRDLENGDVETLREIEGGGKGRRLIEAIKTGAEKGGWGGGKERGLGEGGEGRDEGVKVRCEDAVKVWEEIERLGGWGLVGEGGRKEERWVGMVRDMVGEGRGGEGVKMEVEFEQLGLKEVGSRKRG
ncbi:hypothetical protein TrCOL_g9471 [Triparma columacea]|uniref:RNA polymerase II assembly factor Rtp1 C-terminal domain-containing protein n=1 Tax=Triparma columacea TaxID=722753 RepID=A0A9W7G0S1_9STRA|nr:hypothetical protein TrCOL_g9471 [Triparma columacea]